MESFPKTEKKSLANQKPEKRKRKSHIKHDPGRRRFLKAAGVIAGAAMSGKAVQGSIEYLEKKGRKNESEEQEDNEKSTKSIEVAEEKNEPVETEQEEEGIIESEKEPSMDTDIDEEQIEAVSNEKPMAASAEEDELESWADKSGKRDVLSVIKKKYGGRIRLASKETSLEPELLTALIAYESHGKERAKSKANAFGLTQLKKSTARSVNVKNVFHPYENIVGGARYLRRMLDRFEDMNSALAAYNMGPGALTKKLKKGYDPKSNDYAKRVLYLASLI